MKTPRDWKKGWGFEVIGSSRFVIEPLEWLSIWEIVQLPEKSDWKSTSVPLWDALQAALTCSSNRIKEDGWGFSNLLLSTAFGAKGNVSSVA